MTFLPATVVFFWIIASTFLTFFAIAIVSVPLRILFGLVTDFIRSAIRFTK